jgi:hypothetical protein
VKRDYFRMALWLLIGVAISAFAAHNGSFFPECIGVFFSGANFALADMSKKAPTHE